MSPPEGQAAGEAFDPTTQEELPARAVTRLHLLRHGEVRAFGERVVRGQLDAPLSARGRGQHAALVRGFAAREAAPRRVVTSDLSRCRELGEALARELAVELEVEPRLREQSMGAWEGRTWADVNADDAAATHDYWADYANVRPPEGESLSDLAARVGAWWAAHEAAFEDERVVLVTHIGVIRCLLCRLLGVPLDQALRFAPAAASHTSVLVSEAGAVVQALGERPWSAPVAAPLDLDGRGPRIALAGSAGTGKTTLGRRLADELGVPFLEEGMRARLEAGLDVHALDPAAWTALMDELWAEQRAAEDAAGDAFVSDRSPFDYQAFWMHYGLFDDLEATSRWLARTSAAVERYDRVVLLPWGALPLRADGVRSTNRWVQFRFQALLEGLLERSCPPRRLVRVHAGADLDERVELVLGTVSGTG